MSLRGRLTSLNVVIVVLSIAACAGGAVFVGRAQDAGREHMELDQAVVAARDLGASLVAEAAAVRAYLLDAGSAPYDNVAVARSAIKNSTGRLADLTLHSELTAAVERVTKATRAWRTTAIDPLIALNQQGEYRQVIERYRESMAIALFNDASTAMRALKSDLAGAAKAAGNHASDARGQATQFVLSACFALALTLLFRYRRARLTDAAHPREAPAPTWSRMSESN